MLLTHINKVLKFIGLNLVHAKRAKAKTVRAPKAVKCIPSQTCCVDDYNAGKTHYVGDSCPGGHVDASPTQDNNITGPTS